jgi:hypothetical protein
MKKRLRQGLIYAVMVACLFSAFPAAGGADAAGPGTASDENSLVVFDLKAFMNSQPNSKMGYDYMKLATALQGLVNRDQPRLYYLYESNSIARTAGLDIDQFWLDYLTEDGRYLSNREIVVAERFEELLSRFADVYDGVVVWDPQVPATANVASTAAGVENLLPVRYDETPGSPYDLLVRELGLPVRLNLTGMFTGEGTIPGTDIPSSGSAKNDAYRWAQHRYLDTGRTNPLLMAYALDAVSWTNTEKTLNAQLVAFAVPERMQTGQAIEVSLTIKNTGKTAWTRASNDRLGAKETNQFVWQNLNGGYSNRVDDQRVFLSPEERVEPGEQTVFRFTIVAPETPGSYIFGVQMVRDGVSWFGQAFQRTIEVTTDPVSDEPPAEQPVAPSDDAEYPDLFNTFLPNADYYIANRAFFFDLSPDHTSLPIDDRNQPLGTDYETLIGLLRSQNRLAGENIITIGGFVPWWLKYTNHADPEANLAPVQAEWTYADIISRYNAQKDADAFGLIGLSNASVYQHVPLNPEFIQKNDKGQNGIAYDPNKKYVTFYMGDYDSGAWTAGALPALWNDPKRGELPLAWPPDPGLSKRIPQLFNYIYETMSPNDYFVAGDNGAGYLNPMMLMEENRPDGLPDFLHVWEEYNKQLYERFDLDITGFLISGFSGYVPLRVQELYSRISPAGVGNNAGFEQPVVNGTPFVHVIDFGHEEHDPVAYGEQLAAHLKRGQTFYNFRNILTRPSVIVDAVQYVKQHYPELNFEVVDPYTFYRLYVEAEGWLSKAPVTYDSPYAYQPIRIDGTAEASEWDDALEIAVSPEEETVQRFGTVWGDIERGDQLTVRYRIKWDEENLYLLEEREDDALHFTETANQMYLSDATLLFLDLDRNRSGSVFRDGDYALFMTPSGPDGQPHLFIREGRNEGMREYPFEGGRIGADIRETGYTMEVAIPWSKLQTIPFAPESGTLVGMTLLATDNDGPGKWGQIMWVGDGDAQERWADMRFVEPEKSVAEWIGLIEQLLDSEPIGTPLYKPLTNRLNQVEHHWHKGHVSQAAKHVTEMIQHLNQPAMQQHITPELKQRLLKMCRLLHAAINREEKG